MDAKRKPVALVLAESSIELVPRNLRDHPSVVSYGRRFGRDPNRMLLDSSFHHRAMRPLSESERRGRPDIAHYCALLAQGSRLAAAGRLRLFIQTFHGDLIRIAPETRLPRVYDRFKGLVEQVLAEGEVPKDERLLVVEEGGLKELLGSWEPPRTILFSSPGERTTLKKLFPPKRKIDGIAVLIGAFPHGEFHEATRALATEVVSIADQPMEAWSVEAEVLHRLAEVDKLD